MTSFSLDPPIHFWMAASLSVLAILVFATRRVPSAAVSLFIIGFLILWGAFFPLDAPNGDNKLAYDKFLDLAANPYLWAAMAFSAASQYLCVGCACRCDSRGAYLPAVVAMAVPVASASNFFVLGALDDLAYPPGEMFLYAGYGLIVAAVAFAYIYFILPRERNLLKENSKSSPCRTCSGIHLLGDAKQDKGQAFVWTPQQVRGGVALRAWLKSFDWRLLLACLACLALTLALEATGVNYQIAQWAAPDHRLPAAVCVFIATAALTNLINGPAAAILCAPLALSIAASTHADPYVFALAVLLAANCFFASPHHLAIKQAMNFERLSVRDVMTAAIPLVVLLALAYSVMAKFAFDL